MTGKWTYNLRVMIWRAYMRAFFRRLPTPYVLYGAGQHTAAVLRLLRSTGLPLPIAILDQIPTQAEIETIPCFNSNDYSPPSLLCVVLSSDSFATRRTMKAQLSGLANRWGAHVVDPYVSLPDGPYMKTYRV